MICMLLEFKMPKVWFENNKRDKKLVFKFYYYNYADFIKLVGKDVSKYDLKKI